MLPAWILRLNESKRRHNSGTNIFFFFPYALIYDEHFSFFSLVIRTSGWVKICMYTYIGMGFCFWLPFSIDYKYKERNIREIFLFVLTQVYVYRLTRFSFHCQSSWERERDKHFKLMINYLILISKRSKWRNHTAKKK